MTLRLIHSKTLRLYEELLRDEALAKYLDLLNSYYHETYEHSLRVAQISIDLGVENGIKDRDLYHLGIAAVLHDIGKAYVPDGVLVKGGSLNASEKRAMQEHVRKGYLILQPIGMQAVREIIVAHHEFKTGPYPRGGGDRRAEFRPAPERRGAKTRVRQMAQIVAIADMVDALANKRVYKAALDLIEIKEILHMDFTGDPLLIDQVLERWGFKDASLSDGG